MVGMQVARAALEAERANLGAAIRWAAEAREGELVHDLVDAIDSFLRTAGYWRELVEYERLALAAARQTDDDQATAAWAHNLAVTLGALGDKAEAGALYAEAEALYAKVERALSGPEHLREMAALQRQMGIQAQSRGDYDAALDYYRRSLTAAEQLGDRAGVASQPGASWHGVPGSGRL